MALTFQMPPSGKPVHASHKAETATLNDARPVTAREATQAFARVERLLQKIGDVDLGPPSIPTLDRPVTRGEVVFEMDRIVKAATPILRFTPAPVKHDPSVFRLDAPMRMALDRLVTLGCVGRIGPLAVGPASSLSPREFGDAVGFFMARLAQMNHLPSPKWTPMLKDE